MGRAGPGPFWSRASALGALVGLLLVLTTGDPAAAAVDDPDLDTRAEYIYTINLEDGLVEVRIELTVVGDKPDRTVDAGILEYFFTGYSLPIPSEAENLLVADISGVELRYSRTTSGRVDRLEIDFRRDLFYRQAANLTISFTLAAGAAGSDNIARVNPAYASFVAWASPAIEQASIAVVVPDGFVDRSDASAPFELVDDGTDLQLLADDIDPESYYALVSVANDDALDEHVIDLTISIVGTEEALGVEGNAVRVLSWPGDQGWLDHVVDGVETGLPLLFDLVGRPWPIDGDLTIMESFSPYLDGYAGWYDPSTDVIEVSDEQDDQVLYHELSHVWFHRRLFENRWITEGLADLFAAETVAALGGVRPEPVPTSLSDTDAISLLEFDNPPSPEAERWAYAAAWTVMGDIAEEVGLETLTQVVAAADEKRATYLGDGEAETVPTVADWRRFLDLVENLQGVEQGLATTLIRDWLLQGGEGQGGDPAVLDDRRRARSRYFSLVEAGDGWAAPFGVRNAMMFWDFAEAGDLMERAEAALDERDVILGVVEPTGAELPDHLEELYEATDQAGDELATALDEAAVAAGEIREAHDGATAGHSLMQRIGLIGTDPQAESDEAITAFGQGRLAEAVNEANEVDALIDGSGQAGLLRTGGVVGVLTMVMVGLWFFGIRRPGAKAAGDRPG